MMSFHRRRITIWMAILGYGLVASGLPLPLGGTLPGATDATSAKRLAGKDRSQPFPCMDKPCGCATAEQCFTNCCCNTPSQTLAWAQARGLEPALIAALERRAADETPLAEPVASCCAAQAAVPNCAAVTSVPGDSSAEAPCCTAAAAADVPVAAPAPPRAVVLRAMLACGGIVAQWCAAGAVPLPERIDVSICFRWIDTLCVGDLAPASRADDLDVPPPRAA